MYSSSAAPPLSASRLIFVFSYLIGVIQCNDEEVAPVFKSIPTTVKTTEHDTVLLPCYVENQGSSRVKWWRGDELIAVSYPRAALAPRVHLFPNNTLQVTELQAEDSGAYTCQVIREPPWGPLNQTHVITVLMPPKVKMNPGLDSLDVGLHEEVTLNCSASGVPQPLITWTFNGEEIQLLSHRNTLKILGTGARMSGDYSCIASNGVGDPASATLQLRVVYAPVVTAPKIWIHTAPGMRTEISCEIDASPRAKVEWLRDKEPVKTGARIVTARRGNCHVLIFLTTKSTDFGFYTCQASNAKGKAFQVIQLTGVPDTPIIKENYFYRDVTNVTLAWQVDSYSPINQYNLLFREYKGGSKSDNWTKLVIPSDTHSNGPLHGQTYSLTHLEPATVYETSVLGRNTFGWSKPSNIFRFATVGTDVESHVTTEESNVINDYMPEYVTMDSWHRWNTGSPSSANVFKPWRIFSLLFLISQVHWWHEYRNRQPAM